MKRKIPISGLTLALIMFVSQSAFSQLWLSENFDYPSGDSLGAHGWTSFSGGSTNVLSVSSPGLTYSGYPGSGIGNAVRLNANGQDAYTPLSSIDSINAFYAAAMISVTSAQAGDYIMAFLPSTSTTFYSGRLHVRQGASGVEFGITKGAATDTTTPGIWTTTSYALNTTYIVVLKYEFVSGSNNDLVSLFVFNSALPPTEPTPNVGPLTYPSGDAFNLGRIALRQGTASRAPMVAIDGIRVTRSWSSILTSVTNQITSLPGEFQLAQNYPNPFNPSTKISFTIPENGRVSLNVFDILGKETMNLIDGDMSPGSYTARFEGADLPSGVYYYRLNFEGVSGKRFTDSRKMILNK